MDCSLKWPVIHVRDQTFPRGILANVSVLLDVFIPVTDAMVESSALELPLVVQMRAAELAFPESDPLVDAKPRIAGCAKEVNVIGHYQMITYQPGCGLLPPDPNKRMMDFFLSQPWNSILRVHGNEKDVWSAKPNVRATRWSLASGFR